MLLICFVKDNSLLDDPILYIPSIFLQTHHTQNKDHLIRSSLVLLHSHCVSCEEQNDLYTGSRSGPLIHILHICHTEILVTWAGTYRGHDPSSHSMHNGHVHRLIGHMDEGSWDNSTCSHEGVITSGEWRREEQ